MPTHLSLFIGRAYNLLAAGLSSSLPDQLDQILSIATTALSSVSSAHRSHMQRQIKKEQIHKTQQANQEIKRERIRRGIWHDGRLDCVAGNGVMSELGFGDERMNDDDSDTAVGGVDVNAGQGEKEHGEEKERKERSVQDVQALGSLPIVVIRNYASKGGANKEALLTVLAGWAATLIENQVSRNLLVEL